MQELEYIFDEIESCECTGEFVDEYVYDVEVDDETHTFIANDILVHNSLYCCYGDLFETFTEDTRPKTDQEKLDWILKFSNEFLNGWNKEQLDNRFNSRHGNNIHEFELETVAKSGIFLAKKKYTQALVFSKGNYYLEHPKVKGKGVEIIKSQTPKLARKILKELVDVLLNEYDKKHVNQFTMRFSHLLRQYRDQWLQAPIEDISYSANIGNYFQNVTDEKPEKIKGWKEITDMIYPKSLWIKTSSGSATKGIARYNFECIKRNLSNLQIYSGKVKYYYLNAPGQDTDLFAFPAGEFPQWAPVCNRLYQFEKAVVDPINRFCKAIGMQDMNISCTFTPSLFD